jgi:hypothetical protein
MVFMNIGDKYLQVGNIEDISSIKIIKVDDVYELSPRENVYECTLLVFKMKEKENYFKN